MEPIEHIDYKGVHTITARSLNKHYNSPRFEFWVNGTKYRADKIREDLVSLFIFQNTSVPGTIGGYFPLAYCRAEQIGTTLKLSPLDFV